MMYDAALKYQSAASEARLRGLNPDIESVQEANIPNFRTPSTTGQPSFKRVLHTTEEEILMVLLNRHAVIAMLAEANIPNLSITERESILLSDWWCLEAGSEEFDLLPKDLQETMKASEIPPDPENVIYDPLLLKSLMDRYIGVKNEYLEHRMRLRGFKDIRVEGEKETLLACPCCGYETLSRRGVYDICPVCFWEDSGVQNPEQYSGPNHMTLGEGRRNYMNIGACSENALPFVDKDGSQKYTRMTGSSYP